MADIRIKDLPTTASLTSSDDFIAIDGFTNGTRKLSAATPAFLTSVTTPSLTSPASTNLTLAGGAGNSSIILTPAGTGGVGIGTATPTAGQLEIKGNSDGGSFPNRPRLALTNDAGTPVTWSIQPWSTSGDANLSIYRSGSTGNILLAPTGGNVGIGTTSPLASLHVQKASSNTLGILERITTSSTVLGESVYLRLIDAAAGGTARAEIGFGYKGTTYQPAAIGYVATSSNGNTMGALYLATRDVTTDSAPTERMRIASTGDVTISSTTAGAANAGALVVQGGISAGNTGAASYFGGAVAVSAGGLSGLIVGSNLANNGATIQLLGRSSGFNNWMLATSFYAANGNIGLVPSTTVGGSTFSTPVFELTPTGAATFAGAVTAPAAGYSINASGTYGMSLLQIDNSLDRLGLTAGASVSGATFTARYAAPMVVRMAPDVGVFQICVDSGKTIGNAYTPTGQLEISSTSSTFSGTVIVPAATASLAPLRIPHGTAPTSPTNGDMWTTTAGLYIRINGATVGPLS